MTGFYALAGLAAYLTFAILAGRFCAMTGVEEKE
jgi:hypothetical protein